MLNNRCSSILDRIINSDNSIMINELAEKFNISSRTVRYDLDKIDDYLLAINMPKLDRKPNNGISLILTKDELKKLFEFLRTTNNYDYVMSQKERIMYMLSALLSKNDYVTINSISEYLMVSRGTIINDMNEMKKWLSNNNIVFETAKGHGIKISGKETEIRKAATKLLFQSMDRINNLNIMKLFQDIDMEFIRKSIRTAEEQMESTFSDDAFNNLVFHIAIAIKRIQMSKDINMEMNELKNLRKTAEYAIASVIAKMLEEKFNIIVPEDEIGYITIHLLGSNMYSAKNSEGDDWVHVQLITSNLIEEVENRTGYSFKYDNQLFDSLLQHVRPALYRLKHDLNAKNPMLEEIKESYPNMFNNLKKSVVFVEKETGEIFNEDEIGYLTLHFMTSLERNKKNNSKKPNVLVVCATGIGTSQFVSTKLTTLFNINIIDTISAHDVDRVLKFNDIDVIISTIPLNVKNIKCIQVNTFLTERNISELSLYFANLDNEFNQNKDQSAKTAYDNILKIINENCVITNHKELKEKLAGYFCVSEIINEQFRPTLKELINKDCVRINEQADNWEEAVRKSGQILKDNGFISDKYIDAMVSMVKNIGTYIVILPGIAMPHAKPEEGALKIGFGIITLKNPVVFGSEENDPVQLIIALSAIDNVSHMNALKELMEVIEDEKFMEKINNVKSSEELLALFNEV